MRQSDTVTAACGYWRRRGLSTEPEQVVAAPGAALLLLALLAAVGDGTRDQADPADSADAPATLGLAARHPRVPARGDVLLPCPTADWHAAQAGLLSRQAHPVSVPAECGGIPDPVALRETVRRVRAGGGAPRVLLLSVADDPTGTIASPELLHEVCEAAVDEGL
ncbi:hypothetical protein AN216_00435, partial [Streptomyces oceani]